MSCNQENEHTHTILNCNKTSDGSRVQLNCTEKEPITDNRGNGGIVSYMCLHMQNVPTPANLPKHHPSSAGHPSSTPAGQPAGHSTSNTNNHAKHTGKGNGAGSLTSTFTLLTFTLLLSLEPRAWAKCPKFS